MSLKILLIYFSGTGSTAEFALNLGDFIQEKGNTVDYIRLTRKVMEKSKENFDKYDLIGFGSPVWSWRTPRPLNFQKYRISTFFPVEVPLETLHGVCIKHLEILVVSILVQ